MDMKKKKTGLSIIGGVLILTLGLSFTLSAKAETKEPPKIIQEDIKEDLSFSYGFLPDPQVYSQYADFGITISENGKELLYDGQKVRLFVDENAKDGAFFLDEAGTLDLAVNRSADGRITGIEKSLRIKRRNIVPFILPMTSGLRQRFRMQRQTIRRMRRENRSMTNIRHMELSFLQTAIHYIITASV